jgi:hypothetical protein
MHNRPQVRTEALVSERVDDELVIYDELSQTAHCLSRDAAAVWEGCDGRRSRADISRELALDRAVVDDTLSELDQRGLLLDASEPADRDGYSRRQAGIRLAKVGAVAFTAPLVYSVAIGPASAAASTCSMNSQCAGRPNVANATCVGGVCTIQSCFAGFGDCNGSFADGCEVNLQTDKHNCGTCGRMCTGGQNCVSGTCI